ncbi:MAG: type II secretion system minor pseudopilin GspH [Xanthomonadaceae bacterium]|nr:type II secretion system minor pseudopilin GspH [Xanthomonadaceae bacterium]MDE1885429.1 type II secretion system minor pseudopilin GspH [Xanthomonadaceae bacterium]MDE1960115.1 type II secretion system minor pseudopilin GspH [Xanthomonadaceae bacterium]MDE2085264.1 type II secretion system minor pseudopilin GspH [Xanthomonadaceae bacterium]MDE2257902.1 type II secretion system minor pseudopilin GspH [Xanthomonadaceae bacterium]
MRFNASRKRSGFTLIELLVVVVILAVLAGALTLAMGGLGGERRLEQQARRTQALLGYACGQAELVGRDIGVSIDRRGYRFSRRNGSAWLPLEKDELRPREWLTGTQAALSSDGHAIVIGDDFPEKPQVVCFSSGELTPFRLELRLADLAQSWQLDGAPDATLKLAAVAVRAH